MIKCGGVTYNIIQRFELDLNNLHALNHLTPQFALNAHVLLVKAVPEPGPENSASHLPAHHVTSPDTSRGERRRINELY